MDTKNRILKKELLKELYFNQSLAVTTLGVNLSKSIPVTQKMLNELMDEDLVVETGFAPSTGGRRPVMYSIKEDKKYIVAVAMDQLITKVTLVDIQNNIPDTIKRIELPLEKNDHSLELLTNYILDFVAQSGIDKEKIIGVGIGMPGFIDTNKGLNYTFLKTKNNESICNYISKKVELPVFIDNDSSLIALAELKFGAAKNKKNALVINISWGVGLGMLLNSSLYRGDNGFAGEFSHISLFANNKLCSCGKTGCLETETSLLAIVEKAKQELMNGRASILKEQIEGLDIETAFGLIVSAAKHGDRFAIELISKAAYDIGRGVSILIHLLNPEIIILSGRGALAGKIWKAPMQQAVNEYTIPRLAAHTEIEISAIPDQAELIGAAALVMENYEKVEPGFLKVRENTYLHN